MEIAIPLIALGGMYVVSNQNSKKPPFYNKNNIIDFFIIGFCTMKCINNKF